MSIKIGVIETGYVGSVTGACFAEMGNTVIWVDNDEKKLSNSKVEMCHCMKNS